MGADTRATGGNIVGDKNCEKIHRLAPNIVACGAGTAADCDHVTGKSFNSNHFLVNQEI
jgi:20S proteasome subunit beta 2